MKLNEIANEEPELDSRHGKRWSDQELEPLFNEVRRTTMSKEEARDIAAMAAEKYGLDRTPTGIYQMLIQLHAIIHGHMPEGVIIYPGNWQQVAGQAIRFAQKKGIDVVENIKAARRDMDERVARARAKVKRPEALQLMSDFYRQNKDSLPRDIVQHREEIVDAIMNGEPVADVFAKFAQGV